MAELGPPPLWRLLAEWPRAGATVARLVLARRGLRTGVPGDGRPVLLLPGLFNSDRSNFVLRRHLARAGYDVHGWGMGRNLGARTIGREGERLLARVEALATAAGQPVTLIGVSLGGIMVRLAAHRRPDLVREVITISSPYAASPRATNVWRMFEWLSGERIDDPAVIALSREIAAPLPVPATAIWSASDGLVNGHACFDPECRAIEVRSGHLGVQLHPDVLLAVGAVLGSDVTSPHRSS